MTWRICRDWVNQLIRQSKREREEGREEYLLLLYYRWGIAPTAVNAYYNPLFNQFGKLYSTPSSSHLLFCIVFLEGILNPPFFDAAWPVYVFDILSYYFIIF